MSDKKYIDVTPTWEQIMPTMLFAYLNTSPEAREDLTKEFMTCAKLASQWNALVKEHGDIVAKHEELKEKFATAQKSNWNKTSYIADKDETLKLQSKELVKLKKELSMRPFFTPAEKEMIMSSVKGCHAEVSRFHDAQVSKTSAERLDRWDALVHKLNRMFE